MKQLALLLLTLTFLVSCKDEIGLDIPEGGADLVVVGNIYTSDPQNPNVRAFAVKEGMYIYVGNEADAMKFVKEGRTQVVHSNAAMIMPGCTEGHGHYITEAMFKQLCYLGPNDSFEDCVSKIRNYYKAHEGKITQLFGYGWYMGNVGEHVDEFRKALDDITTKIPIFICDREMHQGWVNSKALEMAGLKDDSTKPEVDGESVTGGTVYRDKNGVMLGRVQDQACGYVRKQAFKAMLDESGYEKAGMMAQETLLSMGYTNYQDAWLSYDNTDGAYKAFKKMDTGSNLHMNVIGCYEIDSYKVKSSADYTKLVSEALDWKTKFTSTHFKPNTIKLFADGVTDSFQGLVFNPYPMTNSHGTRNWSQQLINEIVEYANRNGLLIHTHCFGDSAVQYVADAYEASYNAGHHVRNSFGHAASVTEQDMKRIAQYGFGVAENFCWHSNASAVPLEILHVAFGKELWDGMYPMKRFFDHNIPVCSSTDAPCSSGFPADPFGIMEMMLTGVNPLDINEPRSPSECVTKEQALDAMTINGAWNLGLEKQRGSITKGKYADFILIDQDLLNTPADKWHNTKVISTYFEGKCVHK